MKRLIAAAVFAAMSLATVIPASAQVYGDSGAVKASGLCSAITAGYPVGCAPTIGDTPFAYDAGSTTTLTQAIAAPAAGSIRFPAGNILYAYESATGGEMKLVQGTGTNCASNAATVYAAWVPATTQTLIVLPALIIKATYALCYSVSAGTLSDGGVFGVYSVY